MAKRLTMVLVVIMLIVGFAIGLVASPFIVASNNQPLTRYGTTLRKEDTSM